MIKFIAQTIIAQCAQIHQICKAIITKPMHKPNKNGKKIIATKFIAQTIIAQCAQIHQMCKAIITKPMHKPNKNGKVYRNKIYSTDNHSTMCINTLYKGTNPSFGKVHHHKQANKESNPNVKENIPHTKNDHGIRPNCNASNDYHVKNVLSMTNKPTYRCHTILPPPQAGICTRVPITSFLNCAAAQFICSIPQISITPVKKTRM